MIKRVFVLLLLCLCMTSSLWAESKILETLKKIAAISEIEELEVAGFEEYYRFRYTQPIDHENPQLGEFKQLVCLGHKDMEQPVVVELEGYTMHSMNAGELSKLFDANQLIIEHRFFDKSVPEGEIPWEHLKIKQAATDQHKIISAIKGIYKENKWISTGISKGGQTTIFHRYFYPNDVDVSVPYVAPFNLDYVDERLEKFLNQLGKAKRGYKTLFGESEQADVSYAIEDFQIKCFKNLDKLLPLAKKYSDEKGYTFDHVGGVKRAMELVILEYPFAFWQWGNSIAVIPEKENDDVKEIFEHLVKISSVDFFDDASIVRLYPFYYGALSEMGMYDYNIKPFKRYLDDKENITFEFARPKNAPKEPFNKDQLMKIDKWLKTDASQMLFIYGASDPWSATAVELGDNRKCYRYMMAEKDHKCRIKDFDMITQQTIIETIKDWLK